MQRLHQLPTIRTKAGVAGCPHRNHPPDGVHKSRVLHFRVPDAFNCWCRKTRFCMRSSYFTGLGCSTTGIYVKQHLSFNSHTYCLLVYSYVIWQRLRSSSVSTPYCLDGIYIYIYVWMDGCMHVCMYHTWRLLCSTILELSSVTACPCDLQT